MSKVKLVVIGCGRWGKNLVRVLSELKSLVGICDIDENVADQMSLKYEVPKLYIDQICENKEIDGVVICTTSSNHFQLAKKFFENGKHVFVEKPLALNVNDALLLNEISLKEKKILMVGHILRYHSGYIKLKELIQKDTIGQIQSISSKRFNFGRLEREENVLWSLAPHDISMILDILEDFPLYIDVHGKRLLNNQIDDIVWLNLVFKKNIQCDIHLSWLNPIKENEIRIIGEKGLIIFDDIQSWDKKVQLYLYQRNSLNEIEKSEVNFIEIEKVEPLKEECLHFLNSIENGTEVQSNGLEGISVVQILQGAQISLNNQINRYYFNHSSSSLNENENENEKKNSFQRNDQLKLNNNNNNNNRKKEEKTSIQLIDLKSQQKLIREKIDQSIGNVLDHGIYIFGPEVYKLENLLSNYCNVKYSYVCSNGTDALVLALLSKQVQEKDAIFIPSFTFAATAESVIRTGAQIVFIDSLFDTYNMDPQNLEIGIKTAIKHGLNPKGIITVDLFGQPVDYQSIEMIAQKYNLWIICDAAQSFGGFYRSTKVANLGDITTTSFFPSKPFGCYGDGGAIFTNSDELAQLIQSFRVHGCSHIKYDHIRVGLNSRLDTIQAAILIEKLQIFPSELLQREKNAQLYNELLKDILQIPFVHSQSKSTWAQYSIILPEYINRDKLIENLSNEGISTAIYYIKPMHIQQAYQHCIRAGDQPLHISEQLSQRILSLPFSAYITEQDIITVSQAIKYHIQHQQ